MSRIGDRLRRLERRRSPAQTMYIMVWGDDDMVTDDDGQRMTFAEWQRLRPEGRVIQLTWGDESGDEPLTRVYPADVLDNLYQE